MDDLREKVMNGLSICSGDDPDCQNCPYCGEYGDGFGCETIMQHDALSLLKAQEEEIKQLKAMNISASDVRANLLKQPTVDAAPVVHGKWEFSTIPDEMYNCSICGAGCWYYDYRAHVTKSNYCPSCGAKMDLEEQNA